MTTREKKTPDDYKREALTVLVQWRGADRRAVANKDDRDAQSAEYKCRKNLRTAADLLTEVRHGR
jgi:hypothetical protein